MKNLLTYKGLMISEMFSLQNIVTCTPTHPTYFQLQVDVNNNTRSTSEASLSIHEADLASYKTQNLMEMGNKIK